MRLWRDERGQGMAFPLIALTTILGMTAFVADVGSWYRADRAAQAVADAAVLAGAQALPRNPGNATALAQEYAERNGGSGTITELAVFNDRKANDSIRISVSRQAPGFFSRVFSIDSVTVGANATARATTPAGAKWVAPIVVSEKHPLLHCTAPGTCAPEFNVITQIELINLHKPGGGDAAGAFGLINLVAGDNGTVGESTLAEWVTKGFDQVMKPGIFNSVPSAMFNGSNFRDAIYGRITAGTELYFPVYRSLVKGGSQAEYQIVGWIPFVITAVIGSGDSSKIEGYFKSGIVEGIPSDDSSETPDFGAFTVSLTK